MKICLETYILIFLLAMFLFMSNSYWKCSWATKSKKFMGWV